MDLSEPETSAAGQGMQAPSWGSGFHHVPITIVWQLENYKDDTCTACILLIGVSYSHRKDLSGLFRVAGITVLCCGLAQVGI